MVFIKVSNMQTNVHVSVHFSIADNLPVATRLEFYPNREAGVGEEQKKDVVKDLQFEHGYRLGFVDGNKVDYMWCLSDCDNNCMTVRMLTVY